MLFVQGHREEIARKVNSLSHDWKFIEFTKLNTTLRTERNGLVYTDLLIGVTYQRYKCNGLFRFVIPGVSVSMTIS